MSKILTTLYTLPENTFEEMLQPSELHALSAVSTVTRESNLVLSSELW